MPVMLQLQKCVRYTQEVYPRTNILHLPRIWVKCRGVWGKSTPNEKDDFHKALPKKTRTLLSENLPQSSRLFTRIYL